MALFGFLNGSMEINISNPVVVDGDKIKGEIKLKIKKPLQSKGLYIDLLLENVSTQIGTNGVKRSTSRTRLARIDLESEKAYSPGDYIIPFEVTCPNLFSSGIAGQIGSIISGITSGLQSKKLLLNGVLQISFFTNISKTKSIMVNKRG